MADYKEFEFADMQVNIFGLNLTGLRGLMYKKTQEKELLYGQGNQPRSIQRGNKKYDGTLTVLQSDLDLMNRAARAAGRDDVTDVPGKDITITCVYQQVDGLIKTDTFIGVEFMDFEQGMKQGDKHKEVALPFVCLRMKQA
jgi:hypothetical protein